MKTAGSYDRNYLVWTEYCRLSANAGAVDGPAAPSSGPSLEKLGMFVVPVLVASGRL